MKKFELSGSGQPQEPSIYASLPHWNEERFSVPMPSISAQQRSSLAVADREYTKEIGMRIYGNEGLTLMETLLFIDVHFVEACAITGNAQYAKHMFGELEWVNWLHARQLARDLHKEQLDENYVTALHHALLWHSPSRDNAGKFSNDPAGRGGMFVDNEFKPIRLTAKQVEAINSTPYTAYMPEPVSEDAYVGYVQYLLDDYDTRRKAVEKVCHDYNRLVVRCSTDAEHLDLAARIYRDLIAAHSMAGSECGRHGRLILYAMCENNHIVPPHLDNFDNDLLLQEDEWVEQVKAGSALHAKRRRLLSKQLTLGTLKLLDLTKEHRLYTQTETERFNIGQPGEFHDHQRYIDFVQKTKQAVGKLAVTTSLSPHTRSNSESARLL